MSSKHKHAYTYVYSRFFCFFLPLVSYHLKILISVENNLWARYIQVASGSKNSLPTLYLPIYELYFRIFSYRYVFKLSLTTFE